MQGVQSIKFTFTYCISALPFFISLFWLLNFFLPLLADAFWTVWYFHDIGDELGIIFKESVIHVFHITASVYGKIDW
jgi:hypothetical protein